MNARVRGVGGVVLFAVWLAACARAERPSPPTTTALFGPQLLASSTSTRLPPRSPTPGLANGPTATPFCFNDARFAEDLTVPDGTVVAPGAEIDKRWSVINAGTCDWTAGYRLARVGTSAIEGSAAQALYPARAGATAEWRVVVRAPEELGEYLARWQAMAPDGTAFGEEVYLLIFVERASAIPSASPSPRP